jgi:hypothetical protein
LAASFISPAARDEPLRIRCQKKPRRRARGVGRLLVWRSVFSLLFSGDVVAGALSGVFGPTLSSVSRWLFLPGILSWYGAKQHACQPLHPAWRCDKLSPRRCLCVTQCANGCRWVGGARCSGAGLGGTSGAKPASVSKYSTPCARRCVTRVARWSSNSLNI